MCEMQFAYNQIIFLKLWQTVKWATNWNFFRGTEKAKADKFVYCLTPNIFSSVAVFLFVWFPDLQLNLKSEQQLILACCFIWPASTMLILRQFR